MKVKDTEVVISGIGGKFPESDNIVELQQKLFNKEDCVTNDLRWSSDTPGFGKMHDIDTFDTSPFKMHSKLAKSTDPTTTQTLERAFESIIDAGMNPFSMSGRNIAVISASMISDSENTRAGTSYEISGFTIMGHNRSMVANRISYTFNFTGPSYSIHTSWAGGICALEQGAQLIADGFVEAAVVTTASLIFYKAMGIEYEDLKILTPGGRCRSFDEDANGTCRSEGVVSFFIQRASDAKRNYATIMSMRSICLGLRECSLILFDKLLTDNLKDFYKSNNIDPEDIAYLEADGSGIKMFDTIELNALASVYFEKREKALTVGSIKSNIGNTEASASFLGIIKCIIAMETGLIAPNIHFGKPNSKIPALVDNNFKIATEATELNGDLVAVNALSLGGSLGHVVLRRNIKEKTVLSKGEIPPDGLHRLVTLSARHEEGAKSGIEKLQAMPVDVEYAALINDVFRSNIPGYLWKSYIVLPSADVKYTIKMCDREKQPLWYVFSGMGSQWTEMGRDLLRIPAFRTAIDKCDEALQPKGLDIRHIITSKDATIFDNILNCFVGIAAVQIGLVDILRTLGLEPDGMVGHSVGELGCAYADGCFTAQEMVLAAYARGKASLDSDVIQGMMAAVGLGYKDMRDRLPPTIDVACRNASDSCTLSGPTEDVLNYVKQLKEQKIFAKAVSAGNIAYHSRYIKPVAPKLLEYLKETIPEPKPRSSKWISSSVPEANWSTPLAQTSSAEYHTNNLLSPVLFEEACRHIPDNAIVVEIAPHGLLQAILRRSLNRDCINVPLTNRQATNGVSHLLEAIGSLFLNNVSLDVNALYPPVEYPVSRGTPCLAPLITFDHHETWFQEFGNILKMRTQRSNQCIAEVGETSDDFNLWKEHSIENEIVLPSSQILVYIWNEFFSSNKLDVKSEAVVIEDVIIKKQVICQPFSQQLVIGIRRGTRQFGVLMREKEVEGNVFLTGKVSHIPRPKLGVINHPSLDNDETEVTKDDVLSGFSHFGINLGLQFQLIKQISVKNKGFTAIIDWTGNMVTFIDALFKVVQYTEMQREQKFLYPCAFRTLKIDSPSFFQLKIGSEINVCYDACTNSLMCDGLLLEGLIFSPDNTIPKKQVPLLWSKNCFVPFNQEIEKLEEFLSISLQLVGENGLNRWKNENTQILVLYVRSKSSSKVVDGVLQKAIQAAVNSLPNISIKFQEMVVSDAVDKHPPPPNTGDSVLLLGEYHVLQLLPWTGSNVFKLGYIHGEKVPSNGLKPLLVHQLDAENKIVLFKKKVAPNKMRVLEVEREGWLREMGQLFNGGDNGQPVVVVSRTALPADILPTLATQKYSHRLRCVFLSKSAPKCSISNPLFLNQLSADLSVNHLLGDEWGTRCTLPLVLDSHSHTNYSQGNITSSDTNLDVNVVALNTPNITYHSDGPLEQMTVQHVDYCGTRSNGERMMGLALFNSHTNTITPDDFLSWTIPRHWSIEDAATVPVAYSLAYYSLCVRAQLEAGWKVLVHVGDSPVGHAFVAVALQMGAQLFVTVTDKDHAKNIQQAFPQIKADNIMMLEHFHTNIKRKTKGTGARVIINCLQHDQTIASSQCLDYYATFIQLSKIEVRDNKFIGMGTFIKFSQIFGVSLDNLFNSDIDIKAKLQDYVQEGIRKGIVRPVQKRQFSIRNIAGAMESLRENSWGEKVVVVVKDEDQTRCTTELSGFHCHPDKTYVVVASGEGLWLDVAEWLIQQGARKLFIAPETATMANCFSQRFERIVTLCYVRIMLTSAMRLHSKADAADFLREAEILGPVAAIFCVGLKENSMKVSNLDAAVRQRSLDLQQFVCLLGDGVGVCEARACQGLSSCLVLSESPLVTPQRVLPYLSSILSQTSIKSFSYNVRDVAHSNSEECNKDVVNNTTGFLPKCVKETVKLVDNVSDQPVLREVVTRSPRYEIVKYNLLPVFIFPGTNSECLQCFIRNLMHPAFCATLPTIYQSVETSANVLLQEVQRVQSKGSYNLVAETWGGALALQLTTLLEAQGHQVDLFLIDAAPATMQTLTKTLCDTKTSNLDLSLLETLFNLDSEVVKRLAEFQSWEDQVHSATQLEQFKIQVEPDKLWSMQKRMSRAVTAVRNLLTAVHNHKPPEQLVKGNVHLIRPNHSSDIDFCDLQHYCHQRPNVHVIKVEKHDLLKSLECSTIVNENLSYTWDL